MIKNNIKYIRHKILILLMCFSGHLLAQIPDRMGPASDGEIKIARAALYKNFNSPDAHRTYMFAMGLNNPSLVAQYKTWIKEYPQNVNIPLIAGTIYYKAEMPQARDFLLKAAAIEPKNANIWAMLSADAFYRGQIDLSTEYEKKASLADTANANYAANYLRSFADSDPDYNKRVFDFIKRYPTSEFGAQVLYWLAEGSSDINERINLFENLRKLYSPQKFNWSGYGMEILADDYLQTNAVKALALINQMGDGKDWKLRKQIAEALISITNLEQEQNYKAAITELDSLRLPKYNQLSDFILLKKADLRERAGYFKIAYDSLSVKYAKSPTNKLDSAIYFYGKKIGRDKEMVEKDIEKIRNNSAVPAFPFELELYTSKDKLSLASLKGKVVLLTFWFPACSPCVGEFPHFQAVVNKYKGKGVVYIGINIAPQEDPYVLPFMKNTKYSFIPLRGSAEFALKNYGVHSEPENFLIDKDGKIIFKDFRIDNSNHSTLELMINSLLQKSRVSN
jgi:thiol-disulfide isomerase/thioredoxin